MFHAGSDDFQLEKAGLSKVLQSGVGCYAVNQGSPVIIHIFHLHDSTSWMRSIQT